MNVYLTSFDCCMATVLYFRVPDCIIIPHDKGRYHARDSPARAGALVVVVGPFRSVQRSGRCGVGELNDRAGDPAPSVSAVVIAGAPRRAGRFARALCRHTASASRWRRARYRSRVSPGENCTLAVDKDLTPIIAWLAKLRVKVATDGSDIDRRRCRPAHCRRVRLPARDRPGALGWRRGPQYR
jgi:hypothetical protein